jgi:Spy/CpxP family protein refolding chaperone
MNRALQWKLIAGFLLVFLAGGITGGFIGATHTRHNFFRSPHRAFLKDRMGERLRIELKLTPEQVAKISPIIDKTTAELEAIRIETAHRVHETMKQAHQDMAVALTDEQREKLKKMEFRHRRYMRGLHEGRQAPEEKREQ